MLNYFILIRNYLIFVAVGEVYLNERGVNKIPIPQTCLMTGLAIKNV